MVKRGVVAVVVGVAVVGSSLWWSPVVVGASSAGPVPVGSGLAAGSRVGVASDNPRLPSSAAARVGSVPGPAAVLSELDAGWRDRVGFVAGESTRVEARTSPVREVFSNPDGTVTERLSARPVRFQDDSGVWRDLDMGLVAGGDGGLVPRAAPAGFEVSSSVGADGVVVAAPSDAGPVSLRLVDAEPSKASVADGRARFAGALGAGGDVEVALTSSGFDVTAVLAGPVKGAAVRQEVLVVPAGVKARAGGGGVELVDEAGTVVGEYGSGSAWDSAKSSEPVDVVTRLVGQTGSEVSVESSVDPAWLADGGRVFPVFVDPVFSASTAASGAIDTYVKSNSSTPQAGATSLQVGKLSGGSALRRALLRFDVSGLVASNRTVLAADLNLKTTAVSGFCADQSLSVRGLDAAPTTSTIWSNMPGFSALRVDSPALGSGCGTNVSVRVDPIVAEWVKGTANNGIALVGPESPNSLDITFSSAQGTTAPVLSVTYTDVALAAPADGAKVDSTTPALSVSGTVDANVTLNYAITTGADGVSGQVISSGWTQATSWTPAAGSLVAGERYYWTVWARKDTLAAVKLATRSFSVDVGVGKTEDSAYDSLGPVAVDLRTGNLAVVAQSPTFAAVGGELGVSLAYNSRADAAGGLVGRYYDVSAPPRPSPEDHKPTDQPVLVRRDQAVNFNWGTGSPATNVPADNFYVSWTGYLTVPTTGTYTLGVACSDGMKATVAATVRIDKWSGCTQGQSHYGSGFSLTGGVAYPIVVEHWDAGGAASASLLVKGPGMDPAGVNVPAGWLSTSPQTLPAGWTLSAAAGYGHDYVSVQVTSTNAYFRDGAGANHAYLRSGDRFAPVDGEDGVVGLDASGNVTLEEDGMTYVFGADGLLASVRSAVDALHPATVAIGWSSGRMSSLTDPVSGRAITLHYSGDSACTSDPAFSPAPAGLLCAVGYSAFGAGSTQLRYDANGLLVRIEDPGGEQTDFGYTAGLMSAVRDPLANDALARGVRTDAAPGLPASTKVTYAAGKVASVQAPEPQPGEARPQHDYTYGTGSTDVTAAGLTSVTGKLVSVAFDATGRPATITDQAGRVTSKTWDAQGRLVSSWDAATGLKSTVVRDYAGNVTDQWGPAPTAWWATPDASGAPTAPNQAATPHTVTRYDEGFTGLAATWWTNTSWSGPPARYSTGVSDASGGQLYANWASSGPKGFPTTPSAFSGRFSGWVNVTDTTPWNINGSVSGVLRVTIDGKAILDADSTAGAPSASGVYTATAAGWKRIMVDYAGGPGGSFDLTWGHGEDPPVRIPAANLAAGYGLATSTTDADGHTTATAYVDAARHIGPEHALATATTQDPGGLGLVRTTSFEDATSSAGYLRRAAYTLPSGAASTVTTAYWGDSATATVPCPGGASGVNQGGLARTVTAADPDGAGSATPIVRETIYDAATRPVAARIQADGANWTCRSYDARGRVTKTTTPNLAGMAGHTVDVDYAPQIIPGQESSRNPLVTTVTDTPNGGTARTITTMVDLLGRVRSYTDAWGNTTTTSYDQVGRVSTVSSPVGASTTTYDTAGNAGPVVVGGVTLATPHYDTAGRLDWVEYANGTKSDPITRDALGRESALVWRKTVGGAQLAAHQRTLSVGGDVVDETVDGTDAHAGANYTYDAASRLVDSWVPARNAAGVLGVQHTAYSFAAPSGCGTGTDANANRNTNRTAETVGDGGSAVTTTYCYDSADRLVSTSDATVGMPAYDTHGNTTAIYGETRGYDSADRHLTTTKAGTTVTYTRDGTDRIIARTVTGPGAEAQRYGFTGDGDSPDLVMDTNNTILERQIGLPGGASVSLRAGGTQVWSLPNLHGDVVVVTDAAGTTQGVTSTYDPYGNPTLDQTPPDNSTGNLDYGWLGRHQRPLEHQPGLAPTIEMGARQYDPNLGRFLETDPIEGGCSNDYSYGSADPVQDHDISGFRSCRSIRKEIDQRLRELKKRFGEIRENARNLPRYGKFSVESHRTQFYQKQRNLRTKMKEYDRNDCGGHTGTRGLPSDAWLWASRPAPYPKPRLSFHIPGTNWNYTPVLVLS